MTNLRYIKTPTAAEALANSEEGAIRRINEIIDYRTKDGFTFAELADFSSVIEATIRVHFEPLGYTFSQGIPSTVLVISWANPPEPAP